MDAVLLRKSALTVLLMAICILGCASSTPYPPVLSVESLRNTSYRLEFWSETPVVQLKDGMFRERIDGSAMERSVRFISGTEDFGDLDGDGLQDAAAVLVVSSGGSGSFFRLTAVLNDSGMPTHVATVELGDRVQIRNVQIQSGTIIVDMVTHSQDDPLCCPTLPVDRIYRLEHGRLVEVSSSSE